MPIFKKGESGNPLGRPKGAKDKTTQRLYDVFAKLLEDNEEGLSDDIKSLDAKDRVNVIIKLADYFVPKATTNINMETNTPLTIEATLRELAESNDIDNKN